jgi:hypothetical protein
MKWLKTVAAAFAGASLIVAGSAAQASATANPGASCVGQDLSFGATTFHEGVGDLVSGLARTATPHGAIVSAVAQTHTQCPTG